MNIRNSNESVVQDFKNYYGIGKFEIVGVNLTLKELQDLDFPNQTEPNYDIPWIEGGRKLIFYVENKEFGIKNKIEFALKDEEIATYSTGNSRYINNYGFTFTTDDVNNIPEWYNTDGIRRCKIGEEDVLGFLVNYFNIKNSISPKESKAGVEPEKIIIDFSKLCKGDMSELKPFILQAQGYKNEIKLLIHVTTTDSGKQYMNIWNKYTARASVSNANFIKYTQDQDSKGYGPKGDFFLGDLKEYVPGESTIQPDKEDSKEDLPF